MDVKSQRNAILLFTMDPSVICGMACRVPGAKCPSDLWKVLCEQRDLRSKIPADRFNVDAFYHPSGRHKGTTNARYGYFLDEDISKFDNEFFKISGKEAESMDPQQRILLEVVYEALEDGAVSATANITLEDISGTKTAVYCGSFSNDYSTMISRDLAQYPQHTVTGIGNSILSNRISYFFNLHGPSVTLDTACSSSMMCFHMGNTSIQNGESDIAIVAGSALHFDMGTFITMTDFEMLSSDGRCRTFDAHGNGYARGEGVCAVVLRRRSEARTINAPVLAVVRASGSNHDGHKEGLTLPNGLAQACLIKDTYDSAQLTTKDTQYFEAHGTGTARGDPIELNTIGEVFASDRTDDLIVGSIKSNLGHLEGASGIAGIIKTVLCLQRGKIAPNMHFDTPNPLVDFTYLKIRVPTELQDWPVCDLRRASINSFGYGGSNVHVILEQYRPDTEPEHQCSVTPVTSSRPFLFPWSTHSHHAAKAMAVNMKEFLQDHEETPLCDKYLKSLPDGPDWSCVDELLKPLSLVELLRSWKIEPIAVVGHSSGEIAAAYAAGILSFESAIICGYYRGLHMSHATIPGAMLAVGLDELEVHELIKRYPGQVTLAAINAPTTMTLSGNEDAITAIQQDLESSKIFVRRLSVEHAFHSHHMNPLASAFEDSLSLCGRFNAQTAQIKMSSSVTARDSSARRMDSRYWADNMTDQVRFYDALADMLLDDREEKRVDILIEVGPHPTLQAPIRSCLESLDLQVVYLGSLDRKLPAYDSLLEMTGRLFKLGYPVDFRAINSVCSADQPHDSPPHIIKGSRIEGLPRHSWNHESRFWSETRLSRDHRLRPYRHSLLGFPVPGVPASCGFWRNFLRQSELPWLYQHVVDSKIVFPAAGYLSIVLEAGVRLFPRLKRAHMQDIVFKSACVLSTVDEGTEIITVFNPVVTSALNYSQNSFHFSISSFTKDGVTMEHCHGVFVAMFQAAVPISEAILCTEDIKRTTSTRCSKAAYYNRLHAIGLCYGPSFQLLTDSIESGQGIAIGELEFGPEKAIRADFDTYILHPALLDSSFHPIFAAVESTSNGPSQEMLVPTFIKSMTVNVHHDEQADALNSQRYYSVTRIESSSLRSVESSVSLCRSGQSHPFSHIHGLRMTAIGNDVSPDVLPRPLFFQLQWQPAFDCLKSMEHDSLQRAEAIQMTKLYTNQYPDADILLLAQDMDEIRMFLRAIDATHTILCHNLIIVPFTLLDKDEKATIETQFKLVTFADSLNGLEGFRLIVDLTSSQEPEQLSNLLHDNGFFISSSTNAKETTLELFLSNERLTIWRKSAVQTTSDGSSAAIVIADNVSQCTLDLVANIQAAHGGNPAVITFSELKIKPLTTDLIVLLSLDKDILSCPTKHEFEKLQMLLDSARILWITQSATHETRHPEQSMISGLLRTVQSEHENKRTMWLDLGLQFDPQESAATILTILRRHHLDNEFAYREGMLLIPRISINSNLNNRYQPSRGARQAKLEPFRTVEGPRNLALKIKETGLLDSLVFEEDEDTILSTNLGSDEVEVETKASALNFRDIAAAVGIIDDHKLGDELAGMVTRTGSNIRPDQFQPGDRVAVVRPGQGAHRSIVRSDARLCLKIGEMNFVTATSFPGILITAYYSLIEIGRLRRDEYCLIHAAAGGVGQMAIQLAQNVGARVIATVGSFEKREFLKKNFCLTDDMILSSRDDSFVPAVMQITNGRGFDLALNSLAGDLLRNTWKCIAPFGRMIEIGKRDIHENSKLDMDPFRANVIYASVDLITMYHKNKDLLGSLFRKCFSLVADGKILPPAPIHVYNYADVQKAFRTLQLGKTFGKVVLVPAVDDMVPVFQPVRRSTDIFKAGRYYLLVGGFGGIGRSLVEWMYRRGARKFAFLSRSGNTKPEARELLNWLVTRGAEAQVFQGDAADNEFVEDCVQKIGHRLSGIFQAAMVLRDGLFDQMTVEEWQTCISPKVHGTFNLHQATIHHALDFFACFSSSSAVVGSLGQANYAAANSYLDALMRYRRSSGLCGSTMNLGVVSEMGVVALDAGLERVLERMGYDTVDEKDVFRQVEEAVCSSSPSQLDLSFCVPYTEFHRTISGINLARTDLYWARKPLFYNLYAGLDVLALADNTSQNSLARLRRTLDPQKRLELLIVAFLDKVANVMGTPATSLRSDNPLSMYGLDSIVAVELRKWFYQICGLDVPLFEIMGAQSIDSLVKQVNDAIVVEKDVELAPIYPARIAQKQKVDNTGFQSRADTGPGILFLDFAPDIKTAPLTGFQQRLWNSHLTLEDRSALNLVLISTLRGKPNADLLRHAFIELMQRNESLRTAYLVSDKGESWQSIVPVQGPSYDEMDLRQDDDPIASLRRTISTRRKVTLEIERGEMLRITLFRIAQDDYRLLLVMHHLASDKSSTASFIRQLTDIYDALVSGRTLNRLTRPAMSYIQFSLWLEQRINSDDVSRDLSWWSKRLSCLPDPKRLFELTSPRRHQPARTTIEFCLEKQQLRRMRRFASRARASAFHFILAALRTFLQSHTHHEELVILMVDGSRVHPAFDDTLGYFVDLIPLRFQGLKNQALLPFSDVVSSTRSAILEAQSHTTIPFEAILQQLTRAGVVDPSRPLAQLVVNYVAVGRTPSFRTSDFTVDDICVQDIPGTFELAIEVLENEEDGLRFRIEYNSTIYAMSDMDCLGKELRSFLSDLIIDWHRPVTGVTRLVL
ncbi:hypothetical protein D6C82_05211 [Aureobasidium pullulans]|nr:hypothetical protein D6C82_05211 [Aureobasidium pullulans]